MFLSYMALGKNRQHGKYSYRVWQCLQFYELDNMTTNREEWTIISSGWIWPSIEVPNPDAGRIVHTSRLSMRKQILRNSHNILLPCVRIVRYHFRLIQDVTTKLHTWTLPNITMTGRSFGFSKNLLYGLGQNPVAGKNVDDSRFWTIF